MNTENVKIIQNTLNLVTECRYLKYKLNHTRPSALEFDDCEDELELNMKKLSNYLRSFDNICTEIPPVEEDFNRGDLQAMSKKLKATLKLVDKIEDSEAHLHRQHVAKVVGCASLIGLATAVGVATLVHEVVK